MTEWEDGYRAGNNIMNNAIKTAVKLEQDRIVNLLSDFPDAVALIKGSKLLPVTVYTKSNCPQCEMTKKTMDRMGIKYRTVDLEQNPDILKDFIAKGYQAAPIVTTDTKTWSGFRLEKIKSLANHLFSENK